MQVLDWLARLIEIDTTSRNSNLKIIDLMAGWLKERDISVRLSLDEQEAKANLLATIPGTQSATEGGLVLSGHTDTVPVDGQAWDTNPYEAVIKGNQVYGRGTCDMKGFLAVCLSLVEEWQSQKLPFPINLAFSYDEETGCRGASVLLDDLHKAGLKPFGCIVGEPSSMKPVVAHKGIQVFKCTLTGLAAHSSLTSKGSNAIEYAAELISAIRAISDQIKINGPFDPHFDVPYTTLSTNSISGGIADNIIPAHCEFVFEFRHLPTLPPAEISLAIEGYIQEQLLPRMRLEYPGADIVLENMAIAPPFETAENSEFLKLIQLVKPSSDITKVAYATEAGFFQNAGISTIVCGPGSIEQAHRANEFVAISQLEDCQKFLREIVKELRTRSF